MSIINDIYGFDCQNNLSFFCFVAAMATAPESTLSWPEEKDQREHDKGRSIVNNELRKSSQSSVGDIQDSINEKNTWCENDEDMMWYDVELFDDTMIKLKHGEDKQ